MTDGLFFLYTRHLDYISFDWNLTDKKAVANMIDSNLFPHFQPLKIPEIVEHS